MAEVSAEAVAALADLQGLTTQQASDRLMTEPLVAHLNVEAQQSDPASFAGFWRDMSSGDVYVGWTTDFVPKTKIALPPDVPHRVKIHFVQATHSLLSLEQLLYELIDARTEGAAFELFDFDLDVMNNRIQVLVPEAELVENVQANLNQRYGRGKDPCIAL